MFFSPLIPVQHGSDPTVTDDPPVASACEAPQALDGEVEQSHPPAEDAAAFAVPPSKPGMAFWEAPLWVLAWFATYLFASVVLLLMMEALAPQGMTVTAALGLQVGAQLFVAAAGVLALRLRWGSGWAGQVQLRLPRFKPCLLAVLCLPGGTVLAVASVFLTEALSGGADATREIVSAAIQVPLWLALLSVAVGPALNEELWFRGLVGRGLVDRYGVLLGVLLTSLLFGLAHLNVPQGVAAFLLGIGAHLAYLATRSLWVPILLHFLNNSRAVLAAFLPVEGVPEDVLVVRVLLFAAAALVLLAVAGYALYKVRVRPESVDEATAARPGVGRWHGGLLVVSSLAVGSALCLPW